MHRSLSWSLSVLAFAAAAPTVANEAAPTFSRDIAPIFMENCVVCHRPGDIGPMSLLRYDEVRPWAKSIRTAVANRVMPPWDADPSIGHFSNDISLAQDQIDRIVAWVDAGAPQGDPSDMPPAPEFPLGWRLGEPDYVIDMGGIDVPASGDDLFVNQAYKLDLPQDRWLRAVEVQVGNKTVLHHLVAFKGHVEMGTPMQYINEVPSSDRNRRNFDVLSIWAAGTPPTEFPDGMGHPIAKDEVLTFNIHLHPSGEPQTDASKVGLYFGKGDLQKKITTVFGMNTGILVPAGSADYSEQARYVFGQDAEIISFFPHMHVRGKEMTYTVAYPDGRRETLLHVPQYDFNWQWIYYPEEPMRVPAGAVMEVTARYDNSAGNAANPDPSIDILFGENTNQEMLIGFFDIVPVEGVEPARVDSMERLDDLLASLPPAETYVLSMNAGGMRRGVALRLHPDGTGEMYTIDGQYVLTMTANGIERDGNAFVLNTRFPINAGDTMPVSLRVEVGSDGAVTGGLYMGQSLKLSDKRPPTIPLTGKRVATGSEVASAGQ